MFLEKFKSSSPSLVVLILVLCQTSFLAAAPALPLPGTYHFYNSAPPPAKRSPDKVLAGHPPAAAPDWTINGDMQQVDVDVADLEKLKQPTLHNYELELKEDDDRWHHLPVVEGDELADELKQLEGAQPSTTTPMGSAVNIGGQLEQDDKAGYYNERQHEMPTDDEELPAPTHKQMQREQQQIDDEIRSEINKDRMETMETKHSAKTNEQPPPNPFSSSQSSAQHSTRSEISSPTTRTEKVRELQAEVPQTPLPVPLSRAATSVSSGKATGTNFSSAQPTVDLPPINHQEEQKDLMEDTPQQNEDIYNLFTKNGNRRSPPSLQPSLSVIGKTPELKLSKETLLKGRTGGRYTAHDLAQYVFWTGDEAGVARAIEDLIEEGLMTRESAIIFLRDIRTNIEYLQNAYTDPGATELKLTTISEEKAKPLSVTPMRFMKQIPGTTLHSQYPATPSTNGAFEWKSMKEAQVPRTVSNSIENAPILMKLNQLMRNRNDDQQLNLLPLTTATVSDKDDTDGRLRLADFLYAEYTLEDVIYELAKVMFSQALLKGSVQAQDALQKFIGFVEVEASQGRISPGLQKKVIDVLMSALSDTMAEHPELLVMAKEYLGKSVGPLNNNQLV